MRRARSANQRSWRGAPGSPRREFLHVDDLAEACAFLLRVENPPDWINIGTGTDVTIRELTETVAAVTEFRGRITWDATKPDGTPRKLMDVSRLQALGWQARIGLREGIEKTYASFCGKSSRHATHLTAQLRAPDPEADRPRMTQINAKLRGESAGTLRCVANSGSN